MTTTSTLRPRQRPPISARDLSSMQNERTKAMRDAGEAAVVEAFKGVTDDGKVTPGLFALRRTGVSTLPIKAAAEAFLACLDEAGRNAATFRVESDAWRRWSNVHMFLMRHGALLEKLRDDQREKGLELLRQTLSPAGYETARGIMKLNETLRELTGSDLEYGDWLYWVSVLGTPSEETPWGWQMDGHHLIINCFVLGDQVVATPMFMGSEPTVGPSGSKYAGVHVFDEEDRRGLALAQSLTPAQRSKAVISETMPDEIYAAAFRDNFEMRREGFCLTEASAGQRELATRLIDAYVGRLRAGHAQAWLAEAQAHLDETYFAWIGGTGDEDVLYYRVHSPVILIEFEHLRGVALANDVPTRDHIHTVVRTPNGNDYGKDLLRQHHQRSGH